MLIKFIKMRIYVYLIFILIGTNEGQLDICKTNFELVTDFSTKDCKEGTFYHPKGNDKNPCFPKCFDIEDLKTYACDDNISNLKPCPPGYNCNKEKKRCEINEDSCFKYYAEYEDNKWKNSVWTPECMPDGTWAPKQCKGDSGSKRCFCFDSVGNRIFGQEFFDSASDMTCACSRKRLELTKTDTYNFYPTLHCTSNGNYEQLQCNAGNCWCVEQTTGQITSEVVPETMMRFLICHKESEIGEQYMRRCESEEYAQAKILHELHRHGTKQAIFDHILCDADGSYGAYNKKNGIITCKWRDNSNLITGASTALHPEINCNCARDKIIFENAGLGNDKVCNQAGGYESVQRLDNGTRYCVDLDGYRNTSYMEKDSDADCSKFPSEKEKVYILKNI